MHRTLRRPMFRMGGSTEGITSGLAPRQGYANQSLVQQIQDKKSVIEALAPRAPRTDRSMSNFLIDFGLDIASRPASGSIFSTAAASAKEPFARFQQAKQRETAYGMSETSEDRAFITEMIKGMDEDKLSAMMKEVNAGVKSGYYKNVNDGIIRQLQKDEFGVQDMPGEAENARILEIEAKLSRSSAEDVPTIILRSVAQHIYKMETGGYPEEIQADLNNTKGFIKPIHIASYKKNADGEINEIIVKAVYAGSYNINDKPIYFDPGTGDLFKNVGKEGEAPRFIKVEY